METIDVLVVGGGVIGLARAWTIAPRGRSVRVLERQPRHALETSTPIAASMRDSTMPRR